MIYPRYIKARNSFFLLCVWVVFFGFFFFGFFFVCFFFFFFGHEDTFFLFFFFHEETSFLCSKYIKTNTANTGEPGFCTSSINQSINQSILLRIGLISREFSSLFDLTPEIKTAWFVFLSYDCLDRIIRSQISS